MQKLFPVPFLLLFISIGLGQKVILFTNAGDVIASSKEFTVEDEDVIFWDKDVILLTQPIHSITEIRYAQKTYKLAGMPCVIMGKLAMVSSMGAATIGQSDYLFMGVGGGLVIYLLGKTMNLFGAKFGRDIIYYELDDTGSNTQKLILESISLDMKKRKNPKYKSEFQYSPDGKKKHLFGLSWEGRNPWKSDNKNKRKNKILRFSFW
jgi:hypothetical protein